MHEFFRLTATQSKIELVKEWESKTGFPLNFAPASAGLVVSHKSKNLCMGAY